MTQLTAIQPTGILSKVLEARQQLSIASPEIAINKPLVELVEATITAACNGDNTPRAYSRAIAKFIEMLQDERLPGETLVTEVKQGKRVLWQFGDTPAGVLLLVDAGLLDKYQKAHKQGIYAVKSFLGVALRDNVLTTDQAQAMGIKPFKARVKRNPSPVGRRLSVMEVQILRGSVDTSTNTGKRNQAIIDLMLFAGLRRDEVSKLMLSDFQQDAGRWAITFEGKGDKPRKIFVHKALYQSLETWLKVYAHELGDNAPVFVRMRKGDRIRQNAMTPAAIGEIVANQGHTSGLAPLKGKNRLSAHDLRRTCARRLYDRGAGLAAIQKFLGHADVKTTISYIGVDFDDAANVVDLLAYE